MRLHHLEITAFGPFADTVTVDFDTLSDAGLFLLTGATGSGKTSVLDAVCFALYGDVPGDRSTARRLRSDQAGADVAPRVVLEATLSGRRFRISRSPSWQRPKKRGSGLTPQQASVTIAEHDDDTWRTLSTRLDETGHLVGDLVGMNLDQFCQVAMLPQGRFQAFLRASSEDRHKLLQQLFRTGRFESVERWLRDHRLALVRASRQHHAEVAGLVNRVSEAAAAEAGDWVDGALDDPAITSLVEQWAHDLRATAAARADGAHTMLTAAAAAATGAATALAEGQQRAERQTRWASARAEQASLEADEAAQRAAAARLDAAGRAARVLPMTDLADRAVRAASETASVATRSTAWAMSLGVDPDRLTMTRDEALTGAAAASALVPREQELAGLRHQLDRYATRLAGLDGEIALHVEELARLPERLATCRRDQAAAAVAVAALPAAQSAVDRLQGQQHAVTQLEILGPRMAEARRALADIVDESQQLKHAWLHLRERRIDEMAAEIAVGLVVGGCCPVCGSADHPQPARASREAPDAEAEREARRLVDDAEATRLLHDGLVRDLGTRIALAAQLAGSEPALVGPLLDEARQELASLTELAGSDPLLSAELRRLEDHATDLRRRLEAGRLEHNGVAAAEAAKRVEAAAITAHVQAALGDAVDPDLTARARRLTAVADACAAALAADTAAAGADSEAARARDALSVALAEAGFVDATEARGAALPAEEVAHLTAALREHEGARAATRRALDDPELASAAQLPAPDLTTLGSADAQQRAAVVAAGAEARVADRRDARLGRLHSELGDALRAWEPVRSDLELATGLSSMVDGKSPDNRLQMRLSAYVLAYRLSQVVDAANDRLAKMSDRRYSLAHTGRRGAGENRGGLSLLVRDDWSGETRDPATLSGGETFVVSLALALGLADVITGESDAASTGDSRLATLFVDEGFGSLDADTLDDVMDTLDSLREGGRVVGVVSHVAEMRDRIPTRLEVVKSRRGSGVRAATEVR